MHKLATTQLWVHDQDEALAFYTEKLGWTVRVDVSPPELGGFRWLTVSPPSQPDIDVVLMEIPGEPVIDKASGEQIRELLAKGYIGTLFLSSPDVFAEYETLKGRGVEFDEPPADRPWGIDTSFRDRSGNNVRLAQLVEIPAAV
jgi:catechol 2,3-dioxygenase-like lactoylglutathione lyase family enzyme